jgi:hypothetical protein
MAEDAQNTSPIAQGYENRQVNVGLSPVPMPVVTGLELRGDISINGLTLNTIDSDGIVWVCTDIEGWWSQPDPEFPDLTRGWGDGSYDVRGRWMARQITLSGSFLVRDNSYVPIARDKLVAATSLVYDGGWLVVNETPAKASFVRLSGKPDIKTVNARGRTDFSIGLKAADPIKYEWVQGRGDNYDASSIIQSNASSFTVYNKGNIKVPIVVELTGTIHGTPSSPFVLTNTTRNEAIKIIGTKTGDVIEIDTYNKEILETLDDVTYNSRQKMDVTSSWIYLDPGTNTFTFTGPNNLGRCQILFRSGWIG